MLGAILASSRASFTISSVVNPITSPLTGPSTIPQIFFNCSIGSTPSLAKSVGFVVTPSRIPRSWYSFIWSKFAVSIKNFIFYAHYFSIF